MSRPDRQLTRCSSSSGSRNWPGSRIGPALRTKALILENLDGFDQPGVLRSVPHIFALGQTINPEPNHPLTHALGWGGDGSPGDGSLRNFAVGAVVQHFTKRLGSRARRRFPHADPG